MAVYRPNSAAFWFSCPKGKQRLDVGGRLVFDYFSSDMAAMVYAASLPDLISNASIIIAGQFIPRWKSAVLELALG